MIRMEQVCKAYRVIDHRSGLSGAVADLFRPCRKEVHALRDVSFAVPAGQVVGYIGPNGSGKSTTVKILAGILTPSSGRAWVGGLEPYKERIRHVKRIGVVFGQRTQLIWDLPVRDILLLLGRIYETPTAELHRRLRYLTDVLELGEILNRIPRTLSLGQRMRADLAAALMHAPAVLFLDEPTIGLDTLMRLRIRSFIQDINERFGATIFLTTHDMNDIESICRRVLLLHRGQVLFDGALTDLRAKAALPGRILIELADASAPAAVVALDGLPVEVSVMAANKLLVRYAEARITLAQLLPRLAHLPYLCDLQVAAPSIEEVVARIYAAAGDASGVGA